MQSYRVTIDVVECDLESLESVKKCAEYYISMKVSCSNQMKIFSAPSPINHWLYKNLFTIGGGHMAPQPENPRNMSVEAETW